MLLIKIIALVSLMSLCFAGILAIVLLMVLTLNNKRLPKYFCTHFPYWHLPPEKVGFDGCSMTGTCPRCGKNVLCDSNGDWF